jgi:hypothetical protein
LQQRRRRVTFDFEVPVEFKELGATGIDVP